MEVEYKKGELLTEGKTKKIWAVEDFSGLAIVENKQAITAHDDPSLTRSFATKAVSATTTTCRVFELLQDCDIPVAYIKQLSPAEFLARRSEMAPLEIVARRLAVGSYLKRHPQMTPPEPTRPYRFHQLAVEFFLKTTGKRWGDIILPTDDPLILDPAAACWQLIHSKKPIWEEGGFFTEVSRPVVPEIVQLDQLVRRVFLILEKAWAKLGITLVDIKIEVDQLGRVSDVVDNDSWRLWQDGVQLDKQVFRDGGQGSLETVERNYAYVASLSTQLTLPKQALVFWRGSEKDEFPMLSDSVSDDTQNIPGVELIYITQSGHKSPLTCCQQLEDLQRDHPQGMVVVAVVGRSNGLGPELAARTEVPIITVPTTMKEFPADSWSSLRLPSGVPLMVTWPESNAVKAALNLLAVNNPAVYAMLRIQLEALDGNVVSI